MTTPDPSQDFKQILTSLNPGDIAVIKSLLEGEGIPYHFQNVGGNQQALGAGPARLLIREDYAVQARELLKDFIEAPK